MRRTWILGLLVLLGISSLFAQGKPQWQEWMTKARHYYHTLETSEIQNFSCLFTSSSFLDYASQHFDSSYAYPLKLIWLKEGRAYYVLQPFPAGVTEKNKRDLLRQIQAVKTQFQGFLMDWQNFLLFSPFIDIPQNAIVQYGRDSIDVHYQVGEGLALTRVEKLFTPSGLLLRVSVRMGDKTIKNYPFYREVEGKWLCTGWDSQIYEGEEIVSGIATRLEFRKINNFWMPVRVDLMVQSKQSPGKKFTSVLFLKDYIFNLALQELPGPQGSGSTSPPEKK